MEIQRMKKKKKKKNKRDTEEKYNILKQRR